jgi:hypothetical protein
MTRNRSEIKAVLRIRDILVWIRIRGSVPQTNGSGFGSCYFFVSDLQDGNYQKKIVQRFFAYLLYEATFSSFFKAKKS